MCGIVGVIGTQPASPILLDALRRLEYRGYDSAGIATINVARREALDAMRQDRAMAIQVYAKVWNIDPAVAARVLPKFFEIDFWSPGNFVMPGLQVQVDGMRVVGQLDGPVDLNAMIDRSFLPADLRA